MKTLKERRMILKELENKVRELKHLFKQSQREGKYSWNLDIKLIKAKNTVRGFGILHTIIKRRPDLNIDDKFHISRELVSSLGIETYWRTDDKKYFYGISFPDIYKNFIQS